MSRQRIVIASRWFQGAVLTYLGFTVLRFSPIWVHRDQPPLPGKFVTGDKVLFTCDDIVDGMNVFQ